MARQLTIEIAIEATRAKEEARQLEQGLKNLEQAAIKTGGATDKQAAAHEGLSRRLAEAKTRTAELEKEKKNLVKATDDAAKSSGLLTSAVLKYVSAGAVIGAVKWTADWADRIEELSKATGLSITMLQKLDVVTRQNGTTVEKLTTAFASMQDRVAGGDKSAVRAFEKLGLSFESFKQLRPDDQMEALAIAVMKIENPMERVNVVTDLFGRTGVQLIPTLERIAAGMDDISVASEDNIKKVGQLSDWWETLKVKGQILLVDVLGPWVDIYGDLIVGQDGWTARIEALVAVLGAGVGGPIGLLRQLNTEMKEYAQLLGDMLPGRKPGSDPVPLPVPLPEPGSNIPGAPDMFGGSKPGDVDISGDASDWDKRIKGIMDLSDAHLATMRAHADVVKDAAKAAQEAAERSAQKWIETLAANQTALASAANYVNASWQGIGGSVYSQINKDGSVFWTRQGPNDINGMPGNIGQGWGPTMPGVTGTDMSWYHNPKRPSFWTRQLQDMNSMQSSWRAQNFGSAEGWMNSAYGWGSQLQDIAENGDPLVEATNVRGRGKRAAMGAMKGAEIGGRFGGPYGAAGGALVGLIVGAFRNPAFEDVWNRVAKNFGVEVTDEMAKSIADRAKKEFKNDRGAAEVASLGDIIQAGGGLNAENVGVLTDRLRDAFSLYGTGKFDKKQLKTTLDESFGYFAEYYANLGGLADRSFTDIIRMSREAGVESAQVTEYVNAQVMNAASGLEQYLENATVKSQSAASGIGAAMVLMFDEIRRGPDGLRGAIDTLGPMILAFQEQMTAAGLTAGDSFTGMLEYVKAFEVEGVAQATAAVDGLTLTLEGLHNSTLLNAEAFSGVSRAMTDEIEVARQALIAQGQDGDKALQLNAQGLQTIWELQKQFGWAIDESTQAMLDQAEAQGLIGAEFQDTNTQMLDAMREIAGSLRSIAEGFGFVASSAADAGEVIDEALRPRTVPVDFELPDGRTPWDEGYQPGGYARGGYVHPRYAASGMFAMGTDTVPAMLTPGEGVLSRRGMRALDRLNAGGSLAGGVTINTLTIQADSYEGGKAAGDALMRVLGSRGVKKRLYT